MLSDGGEHVSDLDIRRASPDSFGPVASNATVSRFVERVSEESEAFILGFAAVVKALRSKIWSRPQAEPRHPGRPAGSTDHRH